MRRHQLIQIAILVVAIICGYKFIESLISSLLPLLFEFGGTVPDILNIAGRFLLFTGVYCAAFFLLIHYNVAIADYIERQGKSGGIKDDTPVKLRIEQTSVFYIVVVALALWTLIEVLPAIILSVFEYFKNQVGRPGSGSDINFKVAALKFVVSIIVLFSAKSISLWLDRQFQPGKPLIETIGEPDSENPSGLS